MELNTTVEGASATIAVSGKLTVATSPDLEAAIQDLSNDVVNIDLDFADLDYVASAGLRVVVACEKRCSRLGGELRLLHPTGNVLEVFEMTGLSDVLTIEK